jgi:adenosine deaminase
VTPRAGLNLHTHLEGWVRPSTAAELADALGVPAPASGWEDALRMRTRGTLTTFLVHVAHGYPLFATPDAVRRLVAEAVEDASADGTRFLELRFGPATHAAGGMTLEEVVGAACEGLHHGLATSRRAAPVDAGLVVCALRHHDPATNVAVARTAARFAGMGVVGFDVAGDELMYPALEPMREPFAIARAAGLGVTAHAAEAGPASAVREAVQLLGVRRIGHGSRAAEDGELMRWAVDEGVCFEVCPTSNVLTGAAESYDAHPVRAFVAAGCDVVLGDDDPTTTGSPLSRELALLESAVGLSARDVDAMQRAAADRAFCDAPVREALRAAVGSYP